MIDFTILQLELPLFCSCTDIDECQLATPPCEQLCNNTEGSYLCACKDGYQLEDDGRTCEGECTDTMVNVSI